MNVSDYVRAANRETFVVVQIEDPQALENVHAIAAVDGVDILFLGPDDFSIRSGIADSSTIYSTGMRCGRIAKAAAAAGKQWGMSAGSVAKAKEQLQLGARFFCRACDITSVLHALQKTQRDFAALGFSFDNRLT